MANHYFTFGCDHPFGDWYQTIIADDDAQARSLMLAVYGQQWCGQYNDDQFAESIMRFGYKALPIIDSHRFDKFAEGSSNTRALVRHFEDVCPPEESDDNEEYVGTPVEAVRGFKSCEEFYKDVIAVDDIVDDMLCNVVVPCAIEHVESEQTWNRS